MGGVDKSAASATCRSVAPWLPRGELRPEAHQCWKTTYEASAEVDASAETVVRSELRGLYGGYPGEIVDITLRFGDGRTVTIDVPYTGPGSGVTFTIDAAGSSRAFEVVRAIAGRRCVIEPARGRQLTLRVEGHPVRLTAVGPNDTIRTKESR